jgi:hypothetical protein
MREKTGDLLANCEAICLHLGRDGRRCSRPALEDGFCERHGADGEAYAQSIVRRRMVAVILGLAALWPFFWEFWREISHLTR